MGESPVPKADPYTLRARALREKLEPHEIGRVLLHLNQRRGFLSNRKTDRARKKEASEILQKISDLAADIGRRTLGQYLAELRGDDPRTHHQVRLRGRHTRRDMYENEFETIWEAQRKYYPELLTDQLKYGASRTKPTFPTRPQRLGAGEDLLRRYGIYGLIFFQRPLRPPSPGLVGRCELEPRLPRCPRGDRRAQRFRLLQEVNNLRVMDTGVHAEPRPLTEAERARLIAFLATKKERSFEEIKKHLFERYENIRFNLERGGRTKLLGMPADAAMARVIGKQWHKVAEAHKDSIVAAILDDDEGRLREWLQRAGLDPDRAPELLEKIDLGEGYASYSLHAIKRLLPHLERGLPLTSRDTNSPCALREAGYVLPWEHAPGHEPYLPEPPTVTNPLVRQALYEVRKVVNAVLRELVYRPGHKLAHVRIELAREVRGTAKQREQYIREMRERERLREDAANRLRTAGIKPTREAVDRYLLWQEQGEVCPYSGRAISFSQLFGGEIDIDHILPYSRSLDNSLMNKVVCFRSENSQGVNPQAKGDRTPYEWLAASDPDKYEKVCQRARRLPFGKLRRFFQQSLDLEEFFARQFVDTAYITTQVHQYVRCLCEDVLCVKGQHTAELRHRWGLDTVLKDLHDSPAWQAAADLRPGEKNRLDHRHHALDAIVIALSDRSRLQKLARIFRDGSEVELEPPWPNFRGVVADALRQVNVSHRPRRKVRGALHEDTIYGPTSVAGEFVVRKELTALTPSMVKDIRDPVVRAKVLARLRAKGIEPGRGQDKINPEVWKEPLWMNKKKKVPIRRVRIIRREQTVRTIRGRTAYVKPGNTHHVCLFEITDARGRWTKDAVFVSMLEAVERLQQGKPVIQQTHPQYPNAKFLFSLCSNDMVLLKHGEEEALYRFEHGSSTTKQMWFRHHTAAGKSGDKIGQVSKKPSTLDCRKVLVDPLGRIRWAND